MHKAHRVASASAWHKFVVDAYYSAVAAQNERCDAFANGYATETDMFFAEIEPRVTFKSILENCKGYAK